MSRKTKLKIPQGSQRIGYARVSTKGQDLTRQLNALKAARCDTILSDKASGKSLKGRPQLNALLDALAPEDVLVVAEWDRATRSMWDGLKIVQRVIEAQAKIEVLDFPSIDLETPEGRGFLAMFSAIAERERLRIKKRTGEGRKLAIAKGQKMGRKPALSEDQRTYVLEQLKEGVSASKIANILGVHRSTIYRLK